jgi:hypothetical protein
MADPFKNLQAVARRRGLRLHQRGGSYLVDSEIGRKPIVAWVFDDLQEVRDELRLLPTR